MISLCISVLILVVIVAVFAYKIALNSIEEAKKSATPTEPVKKHKPGELTEEFKHLAGEEADYFPRN